ncbi:MAG: hypothetical protein KAX46_08895 [Chromatiaceae bacterium]|nr:hypothetical protein [Chromatiaceae bacterium]
MIRSPSYKPLVPETLARRAAALDTSARVTSGPWVSEGDRDALELLWDDGSATPSAVHLVAEQTDRLIPEYQLGGGFVITAWTRAGQKGCWPGRYRVVAGDPVSGGLE